VIAFEARTKLTRCGLFSIGKDGHDRHVCLGKNKPS